MSGLVLELRQLHARPRLQLINVTLPVTFLYLATRLKLVHIALIALVSQCKEDVMLRVLPAMIALMETLAT